MLFGNAISTVPGWVLLTCMTKASWVSVTSDLRAFPSCCSHPGSHLSLHSLGCKPRVPPTILAFHELVQKPQPHFSAPQTCFLSPNCISI